MRRGPFSSFSWEKRPTIADFSGSNGLMPWSRKEYLKTYYFSRWRMLWVLAYVVAGVGILWLIADPYISNPSYRPSWHFEQCVGPVCGIGKLIIAFFFLMLSLPVWIKFPVVVRILAEYFVWMLARLAWAFDKHPDFAIGNAGVYGLSRYRYYSVPWSRVDTITLTKIKNVFGLEQLYLTIRTDIEVPSSGWFGLKRRRKVKIDLTPLHGIPVQEVARLIPELAPDKSVAEVVMDQRPGWLRW